MPTPDQEAAAWAAARWAGFPVEADPRPVVLVGEGPVFEGFSGRKADLAFLHGLIMARSEPPPEVIRALPPLSDNPPPDLARLRILGVGTGTAPFMTDRGPRDLPAWRVMIEEARGPLWVADRSRTAIWEPPAGCDQPPGGTARRFFGPAEVEEDGQTLRISFFAGPVEHFDYRGEVVAEGGAVSVVLHEDRREPDGPGPEEAGTPEAEVSVAEVPAEEVAALSIAHHRQILVVLAEPFGNRVLVSGGGEAVVVRSVTPASVAGGRRRRRRRGSR